jgi:hypothetical protein
MGKGHAVGLIVGGWFNNIRNSISLPLFRSTSRDSENGRERYIFQSSGDFSRGAERRQWITAT